MALMLVGFVVAHALCLIFVARILRTQGQAGGPFSSKPSPNVQVMMAGPEGG